MHERFACEEMFLSANVNEGSFYSKITSNRDVRYEKFSVSVYRKNNTDTY